MFKQLKDPYFEQLIEAEEQLKSYSEARSYLNKKAIMNATTPKQPGWILRAPESKRPVDSDIMEVRGNSFREQQENAQDKQYSDAKNL